MCGFNTDSGLIPKTGSGFEPFINNICMSLVGNEKHVQIKLLGDTSVKHLFIVETVLPFSPKMETGDFVLMKGM